MKTRFCLLLALPLAAAACAPDAEPEVEIVEDAVEVPVTAAPVATEMAAMPTTVSMSPLGDSGVNGEVIVTPAAGQSEVMVTLTGLEPNSTHPGHIHEGSCATPGSVVVPLSEITADATGSGTMTATAAIAADAALDGQHIVMYHGEGGTPIVCADLAAHVM